MWKFGIQKRNLERIAQGLRNSCMRAREILCADRLDNSFSTSYSKTDAGGNYTISTTGGNGVEFVSNAQTREDGGTNNNNRVTDGTTVNMSMSYSALKAVARTAHLVLDPKGNKQDINIDTFVVTRGTTVAQRLKEMLGAIKAGGKSSIPGSADNDAAGVNAFDIIELPYVVTNTGYYWGFDSSMKGPETGLQYKESQGIELEGPNVVFKFWTLLSEMIVKKFCKFREHLTPQMA